MAKLDLWDAAARARVSDRWAKARLARLVARSRRYFGTVGWSRASGVPIRTASRKDAAALAYRSLLTAAFGTFRTWRDV